MPIASVLLDTHSFLWALSDSPRLSAAARSVFLDQDRRLLLSTASVWEMAIKSNLGKLTLAKPLGAFLDEQLALNGIEILDVRRAHAERVATLPLHHRDPFDRLLVAQATFERLPLLSADETLDRYEGLDRRW